MALSFMATIYAINFILTGIVFSFICLTAVILFGIHSFKSGFRNLLSGHTLLFALVIITSGLKAFQGEVQAGALFVPSFSTWVFARSLRYLVDAFLLCTMLAINYLWFRNLCKQANVETKPALIMSYVIGGLIILAGIILWFGWIVAGASTGDQRRNSEDLWMNKNILRAFQAFFAACGYTISAVAFIIIYALQLPKAKAAYEGGDSIGFTGFKRFRIGSSMMIASLVGIAAFRWVDFLGAAVGQEAGRSFRYLGNMGSLVVWILFYVTIFLMFRTSDEVLTDDVSAYEKA